ncbi:MAG: 3-oxoacyl-ACP reductase [Gammaproteobacteria bacterium RIFCSPHIGHO2_12_FULL_41_20]|nr:MAG: 3-oxoacyl-ACP reductase [Gammaproteobacteria bacterium RIFCSPHIGHO2_12_FULL_41_20]
MLLSNKVALVTGASRGIGRAIALALGKEGAIVVGTATTEQGAQSIQEIFQQASVQGRGMVLDVASSTSVETALTTIKQEYGVVTILVNNAAIAQDNLLLRMKDDEWFKVIDTNLNSIYRLTKFCLRDMLKNRWGRIISIGSVVGSTGNAGQVNYASAKAGLMGFTKALALEVGSRNITVNTVSPGFIDTDMTRELPEEQRQSLLQRIPLQRMGEVMDVAAAVVFLASDNANYITGQTLHVNGGMYMA